MIRVLLVDDETLLLDSLEIILTLNQMEVVAKAHDGREALEILEGTTCDIALVDLNMKGMGGIELIGKLKEQHPDVKILVLTTFYDDKNITDAIAGGADGYLLKDSGKDAILGAVRQIIGGVNVLDPKVMQRLTLLMTQNAARGTAGAAQEEADAKDKMLSDLPELTEREKEICALMVDGLDNKQIAKKLYISEGTVKNYISGIYDKTGIHDRVKLIVELRG
ncbi:MAG: response regulator transcription factor [Lachnospiraceae bacterium]|nr:response regulator transcription factor [Lachnospiraceae bacterium]